MQEGEFRIRECENKVCYGFEIMPRTPNFKISDLSEGRIAKFLGYTFNVRMTSYTDYLLLLKAMLFRSVQGFRFSENPLEYYLDRAMIVKTWDGFMFFVRPKSPDLYAIAVAERMEIQKWFKPLARGVVVDVGAYIGTYTVRACKQADLVVAVEPHPFNFISLVVNVKLNFKNHDNVILVNKAVGPYETISPLCVPTRNNYVSYAEASLKYRAEECLVHKVKVEPLDRILDELGINRIDLLKVDIEGYVVEALPGMLSTLRKTKYLFIELLKHDVVVYRTLKDSGFKLIDKHDHNYLFRKLIG